MQILEALVTAISPDYCSGCHRIGTVLCDECARQHCLELDYCYRCRRISSGSLTCVRCSQKGRPVACIPFGLYEGIVKELIHDLKYKATRSVGRRFGELLVPKIPYLDTSTTIIAHVPTTAERIRERSFDQSEIIAHKLSRLLDIPQFKLLRREHSLHQVGATKRERFDHMKRAFIVPRPNT